MDINIVYSNKEQLLSGNKEYLTWNEETSYHVGGVTRHLCLTTPELQIVHLKTPGNSKVTHLLTEQLLLDIYCSTHHSTNFHLQVAHSWNLIPIVCRTCCDQMQDSTRSLLWLYSKLNMRFEAQIDCMSILFLRWFTKITLENYIITYKN